MALIEKAFAKHTGSYETAYRCTLASDCRVVQRLAPLAVPSLLSKVCVCWQSAGDSSATYELLVYDDDGLGGQPGTVLGSKAESASGVPPFGDGSYFGHSCTDLAVVVPAGSVYVGVRFDQFASPDFFVCADQSPATPLAESYRSGNGGLSWEAMQFAFPLYRAMGIRAEFSGTGSGCIPSSTALCLNNGRFRVEVTWTDFQQNSGPGHVIPFSGDSGFFWFFDQTNVEFLVKVLNGCDLGGHYWVFAAATTNVGYTLRVTDTSTGDVKQYVNALGISAPAVTDTSAFATCP